MRPDKRRRDWSVPELESLLGVHRQTVYRWIRSGALPAYRTPGGREIRIPAQAVEALTTSPVEAPAPVAK